MDLMLEQSIERLGFEFGLSGDGSIFVEPEHLGNALIPGCGDLQVAEISRIGYRGEFPMAVEWENLLSMLQPGQELLWIVCKREGRMKCHLALKDLRSPRTRPDAVKEVRHEFRSLVDLFTRRAFPESVAQELTEGEIQSLLGQIVSEASQEVVVTSGQPSPSEIEDSRDFPEPKQTPTPDGMLNDIVEPFSGEENFSIIFTVARASDEEVTEGLVELTDLRTSISPLLKIQESANESVSESKSESEQSGTSDTTGQNTNRNLFSTLHQKVLGSNAHEVLGTYAGSKDGPIDWNSADKPSELVKIGKAAYRGYFQKFLRKAATTHQKTHSESKTYTEGETKQQGSSQTTTQANAKLELVDQKLQECIRCLKRAGGTGGFHLAAEVFSPRTDLSLRIARAVSGSLSGAKSYLRPFQTAIYQGEGCVNHLTRRIGIKASYGAVTLQSRHIAALFLPLPESDLPGLRTKRNVFYGKPNPVDEKPKDGKTQVWLGDLAHLKSGFRSRYQGFSNRRGINSRFEIPAEDLTSHILIAGTTGSGKTQRAAAILNRLPADLFQVVVIESAKKTYRHLLCRDGVNRRILALGEAGACALRLNPFFFELGTSLKRHISILSDALADLLPVEALVGPKIREAIQNCYENYHWDINTGRYRGDGAPSYPTMADLHMEAMTVAANLNYSPELNSNYKGALMGRTRLFIDALYQDIFGWGGDHSLANFFGNDDVIIEMDSLPPSEAKIPSFIMSVLFERMRAHQEALRRQDPEGKQTKNLLIVIEEAHNLLDRRLETERPGNEMGSGGFLLKQIVRVLQEGRETGLGVMVVDQSPASLADAVIRNTNTKIVMRISDSKESEEIGSTLGLKKEESFDLHDLEDGEAVIKVKNAGKALKLAPGKLVTRIPSPKTESEEDTLDYYSAANQIRLILQLIERPLQGDDSEKLADSVHALLSLGDRTHSPASARRFLGQKLLIAIAEGRDRPLEWTKETFDDAGGLMLTVVRETHENSTGAFCRQLLMVLMRTPWPEAAETFEQGSSAPIVGAVEYLKRSEPWQIMGAADRFGELLLKLQPGASPVEEKETNYSHLSYQVHCSAPRFQSIKSLLEFLS